jgi:hypothetical protein
MSMFDYENVRCYVCRKTNQISYIGSTNVRGSPDLDTRPPEMMRSTIWDWVQRCTKCGYCVADIRKPCQIAREVIKSQEYIDQLKDPLYPKLANSFLCKGIIAREAKSFSEATWALIHSAWVCDDTKGHKNQANICRLKAAEMLILAEQSGKQIVAKPMLKGEELPHMGSNSTILIDLLRRAGRFAEAGEAITKRRPEITDDTLCRIIVSFRQRCIAAFFGGDTSEIAA